MSKTNALDPWRVVDPESDEEREPTPKRYQIHTRVGTPNISRRPMTPKRADWDITVEDHNEFDNYPSHPKVPRTNKNNSNVLRPDSNGSASSSSSSSQRSNNRDKQTPITPESPLSPLSPNDTSTIFDPFAMIQEDLTRFIYTPIPREYPLFLQCRVRRDTSGFHGKMNPTFYLQAERPGDGRKQFLLAARRVVKVNRQVEYIITDNVEGLTNKSHGENYVGKLRGNNLSGTEYVLYDNGISPNKVSKQKNQQNEQNLRRELAAVVYDTNFLGFRGPRQFTAMIPEIGNDIRPNQSESTILHHWRSRRLSYFIQLRNRTPKYNEETKTYVLQFTGNRVVKPSVKNFQMTIEGQDHEEHVVMQFGRADDDVFTCDYRYPLSAIQAFAIALSSFDSRVTRE